jgi:hypothetical protein
MIDDLRQSRREQLYELLPRLHQVLDAEQVPDEQKGPLRELLSIIGEQVNLVEDDLARWYDNWFIETCEPWLVAYIADLVGYDSAAIELNTEHDPESRLNRSLVFPRREVADTIALRRRKGTLALLEELSRRLVGWPARAVEYRRFVAGTAALNHLRCRRSSTVDVRHVTSLARQGTPFDRLPRVADVRRITSHRTQGRHNLQAIGLFVYRRKIDSATLVPAPPVKSAEKRTFDIQNFDIPLHVLPRAEESPDTIARLINLPVPLTRGRLRRRRAKKERRRRVAVRDIIGVRKRFYGIGKSLFIVAQRGAERKLVPADKIVVANLESWEFPLSDKACHVVAVDPELGRIVFHPDNTPDRVWTTFHYGRPAYLGAGEYDRSLSDIDVWKRITHEPGDKARRDELILAFEEWGQLPSPPTHTVIEIADNEEYGAEFAVTIPKEKTLEIRASNNCRPFLWVSDRARGESEVSRFTGSTGSRLILDGLLFGDGEIHLSGKFTSVLIRHCTFTPGRAKLVIKCHGAKVTIENSIIGSIETRSDGPPTLDPNDPDCPPRYDDPIRLVISDSIVDSRPSAVSGARNVGWVQLSAFRSTMFGTVSIHAVERIENSIFAGRVDVENCLTGCIRFSYLPLDSCTPPQFHCQPLTAMKEAEENVPSAESDELTSPVAEAQRVTPRFVSTSYGNPDYARLTDDTALEILHGADDEGEMGVFHNEFFSHRAEHLRQRIQEFVPAGSDAEVIFET